MHPDVYKRPLLWLTLACVVCAWLAGSPVPGPQDPVHFISQQPVRVLATVDSFPIAKKQQNNVFLRVSQINGQPARGRIYARVNGEVLPWKDTVLITGKLKVPYGVNLLGNFDWQDYLATKHVFTEISAEHVAPVHRAAWIYRAVRRLRADILHTFQARFPPDIASIIGGVLLGERGEIPSGLFTAFQDSGAIHLLVASGGNVGFIILLTLGLGSLFGVRRKLLFGMALATSGLYVLLAGADAPLVRAYVMAASACVGYLLGRNSGVVQGLLLACLVIVFIEPSCVFEAGFEMSFLATAAIVLCLNNYKLPARWPKILRFFMQIFMATLAVQLALLPIFTNTFYKIPLAGLIANMVLVPLASVLMGVGFAYYAATCLHVAAIVYPVCLGGFWLFEKLVEFFASFPFSSIPVCAWNTGSIIAFYSLLFLVLNLPLKNFARRLAPVCVLIAVAAFGIGQICQNRPYAYLLNEWNKSAVLVRAKSGDVFIFNSGLSETKLQQALFRLGVRKATYLFADAPLPLLGGQTETPFQTLWPGESLVFGNTKVQAVWQLNQAKDGSLWENRGYSGNGKDGLSYCVQEQQRRLCIGGQARFVRRGEQDVVPNRRNKTVFVKW